MRRRVNNARFGQEWASWQLAPFSEGTGKLYARAPNKGFRPCCLLTPSRARALIFRLSVLAVIVVRGCCVSARRIVFRLSNSRKCPGNAGKIPRGDNFSMLGRLRCLLCGYCWNGLGNCIYWMNHRIEFRKREDKIYKTYLEIFFNVYF